MSIDNKRSRNWCFTLNNYDDRDILTLKEWGLAEATYIVFGQEVGEEKETPHLQGYVEFCNARFGRALRKLLDGRIHWTERRGTAKQAALYCKKGKQPKIEWDSLKEKGPNFGQNAVVVELGMMIKQGKRTDLDEAAEAVLGGETIQSVAREYPKTFVMFNRGLLALRDADKGIFDFKDRVDKPTVIWRWGATGVGKTRGAREAHESFYIKDGTKWWDDYTQQIAIIIDDFDGKWPFRDLLRLLDYGPYKGEFKGGWVKINSPYIYITCEYPPEMAFHQPPGEMSQVLRRIDKIEHIILAL